MESTMDNLRRFKKVKIGLMRSSKFAELSGLMMLGKTTLSTSVPTACTNGRDEWYNPEFIFQFGDKGSGFIMVHETLHKAGRHMWVYKKLHEIDPDLANRACDFWINSKIKNVDPNETLVAMPRDEKGDIVGLYDWDSAGQMSAEEVSRLEGDIKQAIRQGQMAAKRAGLGSGKDTFELSEMLKSRVDWRAQLRDFMNSTCADKQESSWRRPNRRFLYNDVIMPTLIGESIKEVVFARDASGSMYYRNRLVAVTSEMLAIIAALSIDRIHLLDWDGAVNERGVYSS
jgi:predicted metal-dependent peptidase